ncbi:MAG: hypothetical protein NC453_20515, partial [Muribaculum sp.]|nr:hypothetical protein [Muribaculum sp.]
YMAAGDSIDKDQFCKDIKGSGITPTIASLTERVESAHNIICEYKHTISELAIFIAEQAEESSSSTLRKRAIEMMGERQYISWKIENGKNLWQLDLELIKELINQ